MTQYLLLLVAVPISVYYLQMIIKGKQQWLWTGMAFGMVIAPISLALMKWVYMPGISKVVGFVGVALNIIHGPLGYFMALSVGLVDSSSVLTVSEVVIINILNGWVWASFYGAIGYQVDVKDEQLESSRLPVRN